MRRESEVWEKKKTEEKERKEVHFPFLDKSDNGVFGSKLLFGQGSLEMRRGSQRGYETWLCLYGAFSYQNFGLILS